MLRKTKVLLLPIALLGPMMSYGEETGPSSYDECILDAMKGVSSDIAARAIIESCGNLFPRPEKRAKAESAPAPASSREPARDAGVPAAATPGARAARPIDPAPLDTSRARSLTVDELNRLSARAKVFGSSYRVIVENSNSNLTLTEVTIAVWDDDDPASGREKYSEPVRIGPGESAEVKYEVHYRGGEIGWKWDVVAARGVD